MGEVFGTSLSKADLRCDLTDLSAVRGLVRSVRPDVVFHAAAFTDVDRCERRPEVAHMLNSVAVAHLVAAIPAEARLIHFSTDQVYPDTRGPHPEGSEAPINVYGATKLAGELFALEHPNALVLRTNFFGPSKSPGRQTLSDFIIENLASARPIILFRDVLFSPLHLSKLADLAVKAVDREICGVFNLGSRNGMTKYEFGIAVARHLKLPVGSASPGRAADIQGRAPRPADLRMAVDRFEKALGIVLPSLSDEVSKL
jgi:dTDP-4-dehydrorhamnose reductase